MAQKNKSSKTSVSSDPVIDPALTPADASTGTFPESKPVKAKKASSKKEKKADEPFPESVPVKAMKAKGKKKAEVQPLTGGAETSIMASTAPAYVTNVAKPITTSSATTTEEEPTVPVEVPAKVAKAASGKVKVKAEPAVVAKAAVSAIKKPKAKKGQADALPIIPDTPAISAQPQQMKAVEPYSRFTDFDISLFQSGKHFKLYEKLGSHVVTHQNVVGTYFAVWAPNAKYVSVIGNFNGWDKGSHALNHRWDGSGIWEGFIPNIGHGEVYKYFIESHNNDKLEKSDPFALRWEEAPRTASIVAHTFYEWTDQHWMMDRYQHNGLDKPYSVYEVHLGSWARDNESPDSFLTYSQLADKLVPYVKEMGFTHVEFMPVMEHPYYPSWGYQLTGYFAATSRYGTPQQLMELIDRFHQNGIGVILDWVPSHFPGDAHGLYKFDGSHLYEHEDMRQGYHPDWTSYIFNYGRNEVKAFLISSALFWLERYHADGLRVDGVASMLYLDYSRKEGEWIPNKYGGNQNLEAIDFLKEFNAAVYSHFPDVQTIAEESTSFPGVSRPLYNGGLGFGMKWMMGWMHDSINYFKLDPIHRQFHHEQLTFSLIYAFTENFMLPFSHDEVVYGKGSMLTKMPGDEWQKYANLRLLYTYMFTHPGTKLLFMGAEFGQTSEWDFGKSLDWWVTQFDCHAGMKEAVKGLNHLYRSEPALYEKAFSGEGFEWIDGGNAKDSILVYARKGHDRENDVVIILNMTPVVRYDYRIGVPGEGEWKEIYNSDRKEYWGSGVDNPYPLRSEAQSWHGQANSINVTLPPLGAVVFKR